MIGPIVMTVSAILIDSDGICADMRCMAAALLELFRNSTFEMSVRSSSCSGCSSCLSTNMSPRNQSFQ
ncbi:hypothetical protein D3C84_1259120 [compost metagenome]